MTHESRNPHKQKILWSSISRNKTILVEAGGDPFHGAVSRAAKAILAKKNTPGWEYHTLKPRNGRLRRRLLPCTKSISPCPKTGKIPRLRAIKFHVFEQYSEEGDFEDELFTQPIVWIFAAVYNPEASTWEDSTNTEADVKGFIQQMIDLTAMPRLIDDNWRHGPTMACQTSFASELLQRMEDETFSSSMTSEMTQCKQDNKALIKSNISAILEREDQLREIQERTRKLEAMSDSFRKKVRGIRRRIMIQHAKRGLVVGSLVTTAVGLCVAIPIIVAL
ncbi:hypothetical protein ACA910_021967 [Epithemia clementina (nom. ined.)]